MKDAFAHNTLKLVLVLLGLILCIIAFSSIPAHAQQATLNWVASPSSISGYNVYYALCTAPVPPSTTPTCPVFSTATYTRIPGPTTPLPPVGGYNPTVLGTATTYVIASGLSYGSYYSSYVTAVSNPCCIESITSNQAILNMTKPQPPTGLNVTQLALNTSGSTSLVAASWTAAPDAQVHWTLRDDRSNLLAYGNGISSGNMTWGGHREKAVLFTVCDVSNCASKTVTN